MKTNIKIWKNHHW